MKWILPVLVFAIASAAGWWFVMRRQGKRRTAFGPRPTVKPIIEEHSIPSDETTGDVSHHTEFPSSAKQFQKPEHVTGPHVDASVPAVPHGETAVSKIIEERDKTPSSHLTNSSLADAEVAGRSNVAATIDSQIPTIAQQSPLTDEVWRTSAETETSKVDQAVDEIGRKNPQASDDEGTGAATLAAEGNNPFTDQLSAAATDVFATQALSLPAPAPVVEGAIEHGATHTADKALQIPEENPKTSAQTEQDVRHPPRPSLDEIAPNDHKGSETEATAVVIPLVQEQTAVEKKDSGDTDTGNLRTPRYRAPSSNPPRNRTPRAQRTQTQSDPAEKTLEVRVHAHMDRRGNFQFGVLLKRLPDSPEVLEVTMQDCQTRLQAHGDEWYEIVRSFDLATHLSAGFTANSRSNGNGRIQWALSAGRPFYIFAPQQGLRGFVSTARLQLNCPQVIICLPQFREQVCNALTEACENIVAPVSNSNGVPDGWIAFGPVTPRRSVPPKPGEDLLNLLRPLSDIEIVLDGGLWLRASEWLAGYPPTIRLTGQLAEGRELLVDDVAATRGVDETFTAPGYDKSGTHIIWCDGKSLSYTISNPPDEWAEWDAHPHCRGTVCGALTRSRGGTGTDRLFTTPMSNPVLIGAEPGQIFICSNRAAPVWAGLVPFDPVWAVPADPLHCDKHASCVQQRKPIPVQAGTHTNPLHRVQKASIQAWCAALLNCRRKGLRVEPGNGSEFWNAYLKEARRLWRNLR